MFEEIYESILNFESALLKYQNDITPENKKAYFLACEKATKLIKSTDVELPQQLIVAWDRIIFIVNGMESTAKTFAKIRTPEEMKEYTRAQLIMITGEVGVLLNVITSANTASDEADEILDTAEDDVVEMFDETLVEETEIEKIDENLNAEIETESENEYIEQEEHAKALEESNTLSDELIQESESPKKVVKKKIVKKIVKKPIPNKPNAPIKKEVKKIVKKAEETPKPQVQAAPKKVVKKVVKKVAKKAEETPKPQVQAAPKKVVKQVVKKVAKPAAPQKTPEKVIGQTVQSAQTQKKVVKKIIKKIVKKK